MRFGMIDAAFLKTSDSVVYFVFFPALLFWKIGKQSPERFINWSLIAAAYCTIVCVFVLSLLYARLSGMDHHKVGSFSQTCYRFSTYIGMALIASVCGDVGVLEFGVLIGFVIPFINVLAVVSLIYFGGRDADSSNGTAVFIKTVALNPLIIACAAGLLYSRLNTPFPPYVDGFFAFMTSLALPLALIAVGGSLTLGKLRGGLGESLPASIIKLVAMPLIGYACLRLLRVGGDAFNPAMIFFALPTSPTTYILSAQLNSDVDLATSGIIVSTLLSVVTLTVLLLLLF